MFAPFSPIPNGFNYPTTKIVSFGHIDFPIQLVYQYAAKLNKIIVGCPHTADLTFTLFGNEIVSGKTLDIRITMTACAALANNTNLIYVRMEDALEAGSPTSNPIPALVAMNYIGPVGFDDFAGHHEIEYSASGTFTATVIFELHNGTELPFATGALFPVESPEIILARQNEALTTSLTFFVLMFAAIEVHVKTHKDDYGETCNNATVYN